jgi:hypothetical protein
MTDDMDNAKFALVDDKPAHRGLSWFPIPFPNNTLMNGMREDFRATTTQKPTIKTKAEASRC